MKKHHDVHGGTRKTASHRRKELALALCVSLWMAGGSVASAGQLTEIKDGNNYTTVYGNHNGPDLSDYSADGNSNIVTMTGGTVSEEIAGATVEMDDATMSENHVVIAGGTFSGTTIYGGWSSGSVNNITIKDNTVTLKGVTTNATVYGGSKTNGSGEVSGNIVTLDGAKANYVYGGDGGSDCTIESNQVILKNGASVNTVEGGTIIINGDYNKVKNNIVTLDGATVTGTVYGGKGDNQAGLGNRLNLSGENKAGTIRDLETIYIGKSLDENRNPVDVSAKWGTPVLTLTSQGIKGSPAIDASTLTFANPETIADGDTMNLIECTNTATITATLAATTTALQEYSLTPVTGVLVNAAFQGRLSIPDDKKALVCTASNKATKLTFTDVEWKDSGALINHATDATKNIDFNGAAVDTTNIHFTNIQSLEANKKMTLVSSFGNTVGAITGDKYTVGTTLEGKGKASLSGSDLIFTAETGTDGGGSQGGGGLVAQEQTHNAVMGAEVGMAALSAGNDFVGAATEGLSLASNVGADGVSSFAQMGGGSMRQETGSHVDTHTWNAILALGHQNKKERGAFEYGAFFEYGSGNYTTHNGDERGDGSMHYTGGGLLAKYTRANGVYVEGSLRAGTVHDDARNVLRDVRTRVPYSYETNAPYLGFHLGVGKEIALTNGNTVDVYGKYFYNRKNSVSFDAGEPEDHYDLDAVTSSVIRVGARYNVKRAKWNFYAGAAYEHELDGKAAGTASNGGVSATIRGADVGGASFRGEVGATMTPGENSPWKLDLNVTGFAGKKQGFTGGVSVAFMF